MMKEYGIHLRGGIITERNPECITVRIQVPAGNLTVDQIRGIANIAKRYGRGWVHTTARQAVEIPHVDPKNMEKVTRALARNGTPLGSERDEVVNIVACPGMERCRFGNVDTVHLAQRLNEKFIGKDMPVKLRISISGCPNSCTSPMLNEIGITGRIRPLRNPGLCTGCGTCMEYCPEGAISVKNGICVLESGKCIDCGICVGSCPFHLIKPDLRYYLITVGGRRGRHPRIGRELVALESEDAVVETVERIVAWIYRRAWSGRLLSEQLDDINFEAFKKEITEAAGKSTETESPR